VTRLELGENLRIKVVEQQGIRPAAQRCQQGCKGGIAYDQEAAVAAPPPEEIPGELNREAEPSEQETPLSVDCC